MAAKMWKFGIAAALAAAMVMSLPTAGSAAMREAKKEGKVVWYSAMSLPVSQQVCKTFNAKKLGITCVLHRSGSGKLYRRYLQEAKGGIYTADVYHSTNLGHMLILRKKEQFIAYEPKAVEKFPSNFRTDHKNWIIYRASILAPFYNPKRVKPEEVPTSWKDFYHPRWKGRLVHSHPSYSGTITNAMINLVNLFGWDYYKKLAAIKPKIVQSSLAGIPLVARGEVDLGAGSIFYGLYSAIQKGEPLKFIIPKEGVPFGVAPSAILKTAPHPHAAKVFTDYLFSLEAQQILADNYLHVGHPDVKYPKGMPNLDKMKLLTVPGEEIMKKSKETREKFRAIFGV